MVDPALNRLLGSVEATLLDLEPLGVGWVKRGAGTATGREIRDGGSFGVGPFGT